MDSFSDDIRQCMFDPDPDRDDQLPFGLEPIGDEPEDLSANLTEPAPEGYNPYSGAKDSP